MNDTLTIREMCDAYDVTPRTLRFYEAKELLQPIRRGQKRLFTKREQARLKLIIRGKRYGFSLEEIRQLLDLYDQTGDDIAQTREACAIGERHLNEMTAQRDALDDAISDLRADLAEGRRRLGETQSAISAAE